MLSPVYCDGSNFAGARDHDNVTKPGGGPMMLRVRGRAILEAWVMLTGGARPAGPPILQRGLRSRVRGVEADARQASQDARFRQCRLVPGHELEDVGRRRLGGRARYYYTYPAFHQQLMHPNIPTPPTNIHTHHRK